MEDLIKKIQESAGISAAQAEKAIHTIVDYVKEKIPPMFHSQIDKIIDEAKEDGKKAESKFDELKNKVGGIFGGKQ